MENLRIERKTNDMILDVPLHLMEGVKTSIKRQNI